MRVSLIPLLALGLFLSAHSRLSAAEGVDHAPAVKPVNTICPNEGDKVDASIPPVIVTTKAGKTVAIGVCCKDCPPIIRKNPDKYATAAIADKRADK